MFVIIGWVVALGCVFGVFIVHGGNISVILKALPFEMITIFGAACGALAVTRHGAFAAMPTHADVQRLLQDEDTHGPA